jgi:hypothetical protein
VPFVWCSDHECFVKLLINCLARSDASSIVVDITPRRPLDETGESSSDCFIRQANPYLTIRELPKILRTYVRSSKLDHGREYVNIGERVPSPRSSRFRPRLTFVAL